MARMLREDSDEVVQGLDFRVIWKDDDMMELRARAGNGTFSGSVRFYAAHDALQRLASDLRGFPAAILDVRRVRMGEWEAHHSMGGLDLSLECTESAGHCVARIRMRRGTEAAGEESVALEFAVEPAAVDRFVAALASCGPSVGAEAWLREPGHA